MLFFLLSASVGVALASRPVTAATSRYFLRHPDSGTFYLNALTGLSKTVSCVVEAGVEANIVCNNVPVPSQQLTRRNVTKGELR